MAKKKLLAEKHTSRTRPVGRTVTVGDVLGCAVESESDAPVRCTCRAVKCHHASTEKKQTERPVTKRNT